MIAKTALLLSYILFNGFCEVLPYNWIDTAVVNKKFPDQSFIESYKGFAIFDTTGKNEPVPHGFAKMFVDSVLCAEGNFVYGKMDGTWINYRENNEQWIQQYTMGRLSSSSEISQLGNIHTYYYSRHGRIKEKKEFSADSTWLNDPNKGNTNKFHWKFFRPVGFSSFTAPLGPSANSFFTIHCRSTKLRITNGTPGFMLFPKSVSTEHRFQSAPILAVTIQVLPQQQI